jgi:hypothetical protein
MSLRNLLTSTYLTAEAHALTVVLVSLVWAVGGTLLARIGKAGATDRDGRAIASVVIGGALLWLIVAAMAAAIAHAGFNKSLFDASVLLLISPLLCLAASIAGIRWVFPLSELASVRTLRDVGLFVLACAVGLWLLSRFRGWGIAFLGGIGDLLVIGGLAVFLLRTLYSRAFPR